MANSSLGPSNEAQFPAGKSNLPLLENDLIGREREVAAVKQLLNQPKVRLVTLTGPGGVGKTRLSLQVATDLQPDFGQVCFVALASLQEARLVLQAIATELGLEESPSRPLADLMKESLKPLSLLLVLDNFEHVSEAAPAISDLLAVCPGLKVIATSRSPLHLYGEHEFEVPPLSLPDLSERLSPEELGRVPSIALFLQSGQAANFNFELSPENARSVAEICVRLDGLPLAIMLAGARLKFIPPGYLLNQLVDDQNRVRLRFLSSKTANLNPRQQTLQSTIDWSYNLLEPAEQKLFRRLAVFSGGCSFEAAERVCAEPGDAGMLERLESLLDKSLLQQQKEVSPEPSGPEVTGPSSPGLPGTAYPTVATRYRLRMLETVRDYAQNALTESGEDEFMRKRHAAYFLDLAERADRGLRGAAQMEWIALVTRDHDNMLAALRWASEAPAHLTTTPINSSFSPGLETGLRLCSALSWYWYLKGFLSEGRHWQKRFLDSKPLHFENPEEKRSWAAFLGNAGMLAYYQRDMEAGRVLLAESAALWRELADKAGLAYALTYLGGVTKYQADAATAHPVQEESVALFRETGDPWGLALALSESDHAAIADGLEESLGLFRKTGDRWGIALVLNGLGEQARIKGNYRKAGELYEESLTLFRLLEHPWQIGALLHNLGYVYLHTGDYRRAARSFHEGFDLFFRMGQHGGIAVNMAGLAATAITGKAGLQFATPAGELDFYRQAAQLLGNCSALFDKIGIHLSSQPADYAEYVNSMARLTALLGEVEATAAWQSGYDLPLKKAVRIVHSLAGTFEDLLSPAPDHSAQSPNPVVGLTGREKEILILLAKGLTYTQIGAQLVISSRTVDAHLRSIYSKLGLNSRAAAVKFCYEHHLV